MLAFYGVSIRIGLTKQPRFSDYWENPLPDDSREFSSHVRMVANVFARDRYFDILRNLHIADSGETADGHRAESRRAPPAQAGDESRRGRPPKADAAGEPHVTARERAVAAAEAAKKACADAAQQPPPPQQQQQQQEDPRLDWFWRVRPLMVAIENGALFIWVPFNDVVVDETIIPWRGAGEHIFYIGTR